MRNLEKIVFSLALTLALAGCSNEDFLTTASDETKVMSFSIGSGISELTSKAPAEGYRAWKTGDPASFGVYGIYNQNIDSKAQLFDNQQVSTTDGTTWTYDPLKYWADYTWCESFDFFGYMPKKNDDTSIAPAPRNGVKLEKAGNEYTLSFPVEITSSVTSDVATTPLICAAPVHKTKVGETINFQMDQVLTGFNLEFTLGTEMSDLRDFLIKEVKITGAADVLPYKGLVSRTYTYDPSAGTWTAGNVTWSNIEKKGSAIDYSVPYVNNGSAEKGTAVMYKDNDDTYNSGNGTMRIGYTNREVTTTGKWGADFFAIPSADFKPNISVKYDVQVKNEDGTYTTTRENITNTIQFSDSFFISYTEGGAVGKLNTITVQIVPQFLYVLADADQRIGQLVVGDPE
ncbi:MAG: hypothetical protein J5905_08295 [Prevotella sp.]|nr:hypothetical protein [Prevotella sp.]